MGSEVAGKLREKEREREDSNDSSETLERAFLEGDTS